MLCSRDEWSPLREIVVGTLKGFQKQDNYSEYHTTEFIYDIFVEAEEGLNKFVNILESNNVKVYRPNGMCYNVRDCAVVIDDVIVEGSMRYEKEYGNLSTLKKIFFEKWSEGYTWISGPKPSWNSEFDIIFDGANICRLGDNLLIATNETANRYGRLWLEKQFPNKNIDYISLRDNISHIDTTIVPISEGTVMINANRVNKDNVPVFFKDWDIIWIHDEDIVEERPVIKDKIAGKMIGMNTLSLNHNTLFVNESQVKLMDKLGKKGFNCIPVPLRYTRELSGGLHCCTLDLVRG
jgi:N-dimethylarginine dimethylaminohydrolase